MQSIGYKNPGKHKSKPVCTHTRTHTHTHKNTLFWNDVRNYSACLWGRCGRGAGRIVHFMKYLSDYLKQKGRTTKTTMIPRGAERRKEERREERKQEGKREIQRDRGRRQTRNSESRGVRYRRSKKRARL